MTPRTHSLAIRLLATLGAATLLAACGVDSLVATERADRIAQDDPTVTTDPSDPSDPGDPTATTDPSDPTDPGAPGTDDEATVDPDQVDREAIDFGPNKEPHDYDDFLLASMADIQSWWSEQYPDLYDAPFEPLEGRVYAAYPDRPDDLPGCGGERTTYGEVSQYGAFYCGEGDFIIYDDGDDGLLAGLADELGPVAIAVVLAHEFGHAIQQRAGIIDQGLATVVTEQQADCFAGAWIGRVAAGEAPGLSIGDSDVRASLIAMLEVRDPVGLNQFSPGGHGSGFDRVGAFQEGFVNGAARCAELIDDPLPLVPNEFQGTEDMLTEGNAPYGYDAEDDLLNFLPEDLNLYWGTELAGEFPDFAALTIVPVQSVAEISCTDLGDGFQRGAALCASTWTVYVNEPVMLDLYRQPELGDFSVGYLIGAVWADAALDSVGSDAGGEERALLTDCLTGAWVRTAIPVDNQLTQPRAEGRTAVVSPGDLDEAIQTAILVGDDTSDENHLGSAFEKIEAFRTGILGGLAACNL